MNAPAISAKIDLAESDATCWAKWEKSENCMNQLLKGEEIKSDDKNYRPKMKYTIPGPMTLVDVLSDKFYGEDKNREMIQDLISCINKVYHFLLFWDLVTPPPPHCKNPPLRFADLAKERGV